MELEGEMRELLEAVAGAGSWAVWMGVFDRGWMRLLEAGGMSYQRARRLTKRLCRVIQECRAAVAKRRNERQREVRAGQRALREAELNQAVTELHQRHDDAEETLDDLLRADWRVRVGYRRRREQVEREAEQEATRREMERVRRRARRELKRKEAAATALERQGRLKRGRQTSIEEAMQGRVRSADIAEMAGAGSGMNDGDALGDGADEAGGCSGNGTAATERQNADPEAEERVARVIEQAERDVRRRRALARLAVERGQRQREAARGQRLGNGAKVRRSSRRRGRRNRRQKRRRGGESKQAAVATRTKKRRMYVDSSDSEEEEASEDAAEEHAEARGSGMAGRLVAGIQVRRRADNEGAGGDRRCQEGAAEARSGLGGGGKRGWVS